MKKSTTVPKLGYDPILDTIACILACRQSGPAFALVEIVHLGQLQVNARANVRLGPNQCRPIQLVALHFERVADAVTQLVDPELRFGTFGLLGDNFAQSMEMARRESILGNGAHARNIGHNLLRARLERTAHNQSAADNATKKRLLAIALHVLAVDGPSRHEGALGPHAREMHFLFRVDGVFEQRRAKKPRTQSMIGQHARRVAAMFALRFSPALGWRC